MSLKQITLNTTIQIAGRLVSSGLSFAVTLILARILGANFFGEYIKISAFVTLFYLGVDFGLNLIFLKTAARSDLVKLPQFLGLRLGLGLVLAVLAVVGIYILSLVNPGFTVVMRSGVVIGSLAIIMYAFWLSLGAVFQLRLRFDQAALAEVVGAGVVLILVVGFAAFFLQPIQGVLLATWLLVLDLGISVVVGQVFLKLPRRNWWPQIDWQLWRKWFGESWPLGATLILNVIYFRIDTLILTAYRSSGEVGAYGLAYKFFELLLILPTFAMNSIYPLWLKRQTYDRKFWQQLKLLFGGLLLLSIIGGGVGWGLAPLVVYLKSDYVSSVGFLRLLLLSLPIFYLTSPLMWLFVLLNAQRKLLVVYGSATVLNVAANLWLVPQSGAAASAIITGITELWVLIWAYLKFKKLTYAKLS